MFNITNGLQYFICPISQIHHRGRDVNVPMGPEDSPAPITAKIKGWLGDIMYGRAEHQWGIVVPEKQ
jgi:branched-chain amino acid aminotransferase